MATLRFLADIDISSNKIQNLADGTSAGDAVNKGQLDGKLGTTLNSAQVFVGNASNVATAVTLSGDVLLSNAGVVTIANDSVTYAKMQNVSATSRLLGRVSTGSGDVEELTGTQATALLDNFTSTLKGLVPGSGGGTSNFLRADGTWAAPIGSITGAGTTNYLVKYTGTNAIGISQIFDNGTNVGIGTTSPGSPLVIRGTTTTDGGQLGVEQLSSANWTTTGWTGDFTTGFTNGTSNTSPLTNTLAAVVNNYYQIAYTITGNTGGGSLTISFGGQSVSGVTTTGAWGPRATTTGTLSITPTTDFNGTVVISIRVISAGSATMAILNSGGTTRIEIRATGDEQNTFMGLNSGANNTTGKSNTAIGSSALRYNTTGVDNSAVGREALLSNTTGSNNMALGRFSLGNNTTGFSNVAIGSFSLGNNTTGYTNTALGRDAMIGNTTGYRNVAVGNNALRTNTTGDAIVAIGENALRNSTGNSGVAVGQGSLENNTTGVGNIGIGRGTLARNTTGSENVAIGLFAGVFLADGTTGNTIAKNSLYIGAGTRSTGNDQDNQIVIGYNAIGEGSNSVVLGNTAITKTVLRGNVGIGTTSPSQALHVVGNLLIDGANQNRYIQTEGTQTATGRLIVQAGAQGANYGGAVNLFAHAHATKPGWVTVGLSSGAGGKFTVNSQALGGGTDVFVVQDNGNVGIGETSPAVKFVSNGQSQINGVLSLKGNGNTAFSTGTASELRLWNDNSSKTFSLHHTNNSQFRILDPSTNLCWQITDGGKFVVNVADNDGTAFSASILGGGSTFLQMDSTNDNERLILGSVTTGAALKLQGGRHVDITTLTANFTLRKSDYVVEANATSGAFTITLPAAPVTGQVYYIVRINSGANNVTIDGNAKNINGAATLVLSNQYDTAQIVYNGTQWLKI